MSRKTKKARRDQLKYPAFDISYAPKIRRELLDIDYLDQLSDEEKAWMNQFLEEYVGADLDFKNLKNNLHNTKKLKKDCTDRNNARNRDMLGFAKANGLVVPDEQLKDHHLNMANPDIAEDAMIAYLDNKAKLESIPKVRIKKKIKKKKKSKKRKILSRKLFKKIKKRRKKR